MATSLYGNRWKPTGRTIGQGGQGQALEVTDTSGKFRSDERFVLKRLANLRRVGRFEQEAEALEAINSQFVPRLIDFSLEPPKPYIVSPFVGVNLEEYFRNHATSFAFALQAVESVLSALADARNAGVSAHRDIKPDNVCIDSDANIRLIDFGICQFEDGRLFTTVVDEAFGNRAFAAPECELGAAAEPDERSDVYSVGKLLYWGVTGGGFINRENIDAVSGSIPQENGTEEGHTIMLLRGMVLEAPQDRWRVQEALARVREARQLHAYGQNAVGYELQLCTRCRRSYMKHDKMRQEYSNVPPKEQMFLCCSSCGAVDSFLLNSPERSKLWPEVRG